MLTNKEIYLQPIGYLNPHETTDQIFDTVGEGQTLETLVSYK